MGKLYDDFINMTYGNESEVSQKFIVPLLQQFLGYGLHEILPEQKFPAKTLHSGVYFNENGTKGLVHKPDFVICLDGILEQVKFIVDAKAPGEDIDLHLGQLKSYSNSVGQNFLMITNGTALKVLDANEVIFHSLEIADLQIKFPQLFALLGRTNQALKKRIEILKELDYDKAIVIIPEDMHGWEVNKKKIILSDFLTYLSNLKSLFSSWHIPSDNFRALDNMAIEQLDPRSLLTFMPGHSRAETIDKKIKFAQIESDYIAKIKIFTGDTGIGKTTLLKFLCYTVANDCLNYLDTRVPVFIALREIGPNKALETLILEAFGRYGYTCSDIFHVLAKNDFVFYLDAYDEIPDEYASQAYQSIQHLSTRFSCFITTRPIRIPKFNASQTFQISPLGADQVESIAELYLPSSHFQFNRQLNSKGLNEEARNILLLLFLISLFKENGSLPDSVSKILSMIVSRVRSWQDEKSSIKSNSPLPHELSTSILAKLAFEALNSGSTTINRSTAEQIILEHLETFERQRRIKPGVLLQEIFDVLARTGLLIVTADYSYFWHRLFLNYFAASELITQFLLDEAVLHKFIDDPDKELIVIAMAAQLPDTTKLLSIIRKHLWLAAYCLSESQHHSQGIDDEIIEDLLQKTHSPILAIRETAISYLLSFRNDKTDAFFAEAIDRDHYPDIKMAALIAIAKSQSDAAKKIVYDHLDWNESAFMSGPCSQSSICHALSFFGEEGRVQIISNWEKYHSFQLDNTFVDIFTRLHAQGELTPRLITELQSSFIKFCEEKRPGFGKLDSLSQILSRVKDKSFVPTVLSILFGKVEFSSYSRIEDLLSSYSSLNAATLMLDAIMANPNTAHGAEHCAKALLRFSSPIPLSFFTSLISHPLEIVQITGLHGLNRFDYSEVKDILDEYLISNNPRLQAAAMHVLVSNGELISLTKRNTWPEFLYIPTVHTILEGIRKYHLIEAVDLLERVSRNLKADKMYESEYNIAFDLSQTYYVIGKETLSKEIVNLYFDGKIFLQSNKILHQNLMRYANALEVNLGVQIAICFYQTYFPRGDEEYHYETEVFIECAEKIHSDKLKPYLKLITSNFLDQVRAGNIQSQHLIERPLRALVTIGSQEDENWVIAQIPFLSNGDGSDAPQLRRAIECLSNFGGLESIPVIRAVAEAHRFEDKILTTCQIAINNISRRNHQWPEPLL